MLKRAEQLYLGDPEEGENQRQWFTKFHEAPPFMQKEIIEKYNNRLKEYSEQRGIPPNANGNYPDQIKFQVGPDGKVILNETPASFAAKDALASIEGDYIQKSQKVFDKDIAEYMLDNKKADADALYKKLMGAAANKKANAYVANIHSQIKAREGEPEEQQTYLDDIWKRNLLQQKQLITPAGGNNIGQAKVENQNSLPLFTFDSNGKPTILKPIGGKEIVKNNKLIGYEGGYYSQRYLQGGKPLELPNIWAMYNQDLPILKKMGFTGGVDEYLKGLIEDGVIDVKLVGANGASDKGINTNALKAISNPLTKKGQEGIFEIPEIPEEPQ